MLRQIRAVPLPTAHLPTAHLLTAKMCIRDRTNTDNEYTVYGTIAGFAGDCTISDCVSNVSFNNNGKYVYGFIGGIKRAF